MATITPSEIFAQKQILTLETAMELKGRKIATTHPTYKHNSPSVTTFTVGEIVSKYDLAKKEIDPERFPQGSQAAYWESYMTEAQIEEAKTTLVLLSDEGLNFHINCHTKFDNWFDIPTFTCSDADREVYYIEIK